MADDEGNQVTRKPGDQLPPDHRITRLPGHPIGVFDSGIGGLTVVRALRARMPNENIIYLGDTARVPYGTKSAEAITRFALEDAAFLVRREVKLIVVACHSASSVALPELGRKLNVPVVGVVEPGARALVAATETNRVAVIGTAATIRSAAYEKTIRALRPNIEILAKATPLFVPLADEGWVGAEPADGSQRPEVVEMICRDYLGGLADEGIDALLLGCTHFPLLSGAIGRILGPGVRLVDSSEETAAAAAKLLEKKALLNTESGAQMRIYLTDLAPNFETTGARFLGMPVGEVVRVSLGNSK